MEEYITRASAVAVLHYNCDEACSSVVCEMEDIPAADVAPVVHGHWEDDVYTDPYGAKWTKYRCSLCGRIEVVKEPYCNCGAKMEV